MSWLSRIAFVLGLWAVTATAFDALMPMNRQYTGSEAQRDRLGKTKRERGRMVVVTALTGALGCVALDSLIRLGKRIRASNSLIRNGGTNADRGTELSTPPRPTADLPNWTSSQPRGDMGIEASRIAADRRA